MMLYGRLIDLRNYCSFHLQKIALNRGLLDGHSDYCKFIILARGRSGSNFLRGLLNSHSGVITFGELFRFCDSIGWEFPEYDRYLQSRNLISLMQKDPCKFLETDVFRKFQKGILAVGFKIFYYHAQEDPRKNVWTYLKNRKDLKIIHLKRNNTLRVIFSLKKASKTNKWTNTTGEIEEDFTVPLDYEECRQAFIWAQEVKKNMISSLRLITRSTSFTRIYRKTI